ncbi:C6 zinc finger protein [Thozetella sp. PMI_491]|nr:C6 zinc finger protein [Thozetella sp. PMI_491]
MSTRSGRSSRETPPASPSPLLERQPTRRSHAKSRSGCKTCKRRKVKCNEARPSCGNCVKHGVECDFLQAKSQSRRAQGLGLNMQDLELMHNFTTSTYATFSWDPTLRYVWRDAAVTIGLDCEYIMRTVLAISALHMASRNRDRRDYFVETALAHHRIASRQVMEIMSQSEVGTDNVRNLFLFSTLTIYFALGAPRDEPEGTLLAGEPNFPNWLFLLRGSKSLLHIGRDECHAGPLEPLFKHSGERYRMTHPGPRPATGYQWPPSSGQELLTDLHELICRRVADPQDREIYSLAIEELRGLYHLYHESPTKMDLVDAMVWVYAGIDGFMDRLAMPAQEAVAIFVHYCILVRKQTVPLWLDGWAEHLLSKSYAILDPEHRAWVAAVIEDAGWLPPT